MSAGVMAFWIGTGISAALLGAFALRPATTQPILDGDGQEAEGSVAEIVRLEVNDTEQFIILRGRDASKPVLLFLHGGPGTPETPFIRRWNPGMEDHVVLAMWEQRGAGKSYSRQIDPARLTTEQLLEDAREITRYLKRRFGRERILVAGHSWGTYLGLLLVQRYPDDYLAYIGISQTSHGQREAAAIHEWLMQQATQADDHRALAELEPLRPASGHPLPLPAVSTMLRWVNRYGGAAFHGRHDSFRRLVWGVLTTDEYTLFDKLNYLRGERLALERLHGELASIDLFRKVPKLDVPVYLVHGRHDYQVPLEVAQDYYEHLQAPHKELHVFEKSAHGVLIEEPERFNALLANIVRDVQGSSSPAHPRLDDHQATSSDSGSIADSISRSWSDSCSGSGSRCSNRSHAEAAPGPSTRQDIALNVSIAHCLPRIEARTRMII